MNRLIRKLLFPLPYVVRWYLSRERTYQYKDLSIVVLPGVFHPGLFFSTNMLLEFISRQSLAGLKVLEVGAGTGIISLLAGRMGAEVTATDISSVAIENIRRNALKNNAQFTIIQSDLFERVRLHKYDWIIVNPPYYPRNPKKEEDYAWHCGEQYEYFEKFFAGVLAYLSDRGQIIMVLSDVCDLVTIKRIGKENGFEFVIVLEQEVWLDGKNYIFRVNPVML
ncbi:class I SAM-dependent methyltransferase [soil metagenome]